MIDGQLLTAGHDRQTARRGHAARQQHDDVQRRFVGPVNILDHQQGRARTQFVEKHREDLVQRSATPDHLAEWAT